MHFIKAVLAAPLLAIAAPALADPSNVGPPPGAIYELTGKPLSTAFSQYSFSFTALYASTSLTFAMRNDPTYINLDDISVSGLAGIDLVTNGGFEAGPDDDGQAPGWTYLNQYGAGAGGRVQSGAGHSGDYGYHDGAIQAYDGITQAIATNVGEVYTVSFWAALSSEQEGVFQPYSTNGDITGTNGNGIDLFVYADAAPPPPPTSAVPEPASWAMMIGGFGFVGGAMRRRRMNLATC